MIKAILNLYNKIFLTHTFPQSWGRSISVPIPKANKDLTDPIHYRQISLTSCLCKVMKITNFRLMWYLEKHNKVVPIESTGKTEAQQITLFK